MLIGKQDRFTKETVDDLVAILGQKSLHLKSQAQFGTFVIAVDKINEKIHGHLKSTMTYLG